MEFKPPVKERETDDLIRIVKYPKKWVPEIVEQAKIELLKRNISEEFQEKKFRSWQEIKRQKRRTNAKRKAEEQYVLADFIFNLDHTIFEMLFDWNLKKKGYVQKHEFRMYFLSALFTTIAILIYLLNF